MVVSVRVIIQNIANTSTMDSIEDMADSDTSSDDETEDTARELA